MTRFDRAAPGEGMIVYSRVENGKAYLEFQFFLKISDIQSESAKEESAENEQLNASEKERDENYLADIRIYDMSGRMALEMRYPLREEELAKGMILHPRLWKGIEDPYLYSVVVFLLEERDVKAPLDRLERQLPLRKLEEIPKKGWFMNERPFTARTVRYNREIRPYRQECIKADLLLLKQMGANTVCLIWTEYGEEFNMLCDEMGLLVWYGEVQQNIPKVDELLKEDGTVSDLYSYYRGSWSSEPFVSIVCKSLKRQKNGNFTLMVYSNQKRVALYVEGVLFEFKVGAPEFIFEEIPAGKYPLQLTAEAGECRVSFTAYY